MGHIFTIHIFHANSYRRLGRVVITLGDEKPLEFRCSRDYGDSDAKICIVGNMSPGGQLGGESTLAGDSGVLFTVYAEKPTRYSDRPE